MPVAGEDPRGRRRGGGGGKVGPVRHVVPVLHAAAVVIVAGVLLLPHTIENENCF